MMRCSGLTSEMSMRLLSCSLKKRIVVRVHFALTKPPSRTLHLTVDYLLSGSWSNNSQCKAKKVRLSIDLCSDERKTASARLLPPPRNAQHAPEASAAVSQRMAGARRDRFIVMNAPSGEPRID